MFSEVEICSGMALIFVEQVVCVASVIANLAVCLNV